MSWRSGPPVALLCTALALGACGNGDAGRALSQGVGAGIGAVLGAVIGSQFGSGAANTIATAAGAALGAYFGGQVFASLTESDRGLARETQIRALEDRSPGRTASWRNPETGNSGEVAAAEPQAHNGQSCRKFVHTVVVRNEGAPRQAEGLACRQADGSWTVVGS